ncbi:MAG: amidohydrolase family protein [Planctomycetaceae bacterium]
MSTTATTEQTSMREVDREFYEREINGFLPDRIFDAHCHLWSKDWVPWSLTGKPEDIGYDKYMTYIRDLHGERPTSAMFIPYVTVDHKDRIPDANAWVANAIADDPNCRGIYFIKPEDDPEYVRQEVRRLGLHGLKCYHTMSSRSPTWECDIPEYLPEALIKVAHEEEWVITLHIVKSRAVADPKNIHWIRHYCKNYPGMKLILAHSARGFQPSHNLEGLAELKGLDNLWFDSSANCEPIAHQAIFRILGHKNFMYGSDLPVSHMRGRSLSAADTFIWVYEQTPVWDEKHRKIEPILVGLEHLRSLKWACWSEKLSDTAVEDIFWNNAARLFGVK